MTSVSTRLALLALILAGCSEPAVPTAPTPTVRPAPTTGPADLLAHADARTLSPDLVAQLSNPDPALRRAAALALARLHDPATAPHLMPGLRDPDPVVREHASLGLGALEAQAPDGAAPALLGALAAEPDPVRRALHLEDAGRLATDEVLAALPAALASDHADERRGACRALGSVGLRGRSIAPELQRRVADRVVDDSSPAVRLACAYSLTRLPPPEDAADLDAVGSPLVRAISDPDADVRAMAYRALSRYPVVEIPRLAEGTGDPDWTVAVHAVRALAQRAAEEHREADLATALRAVVARLLTGDDVASGGPLHVALAALESAGPTARDAAVHAAAEDALARLARVPEHVPATRDRGHAHCAAARLVDLGRGWPARVLTCGLEQVSEAERKVLAAEVIGAVAGSEPQRVVFVEQRLLSDETSIVRQAALTALGSMDSPAALALVVRALRAETDIGARIAAMEALRAARARRSAQLAAQLLSGTPAPDAWPHADAVRGLRATGEAMIESDDLEGLVTWLAVAREVAPRELIELALPLASHPNVAVRGAARDVIEEAGAELPAVTPAAPPNALSADAIAGAPTGRVVVETDRGRFVIALRSDLAPTTVVRFASLVREGFYDGLPFHRVVPAFVVQGGDPRGDGYGGPGWSQPCEDHRLPYERGTVGMALAGRDTGGSQFFVTVTPQPHLDGRYTAFGQVVEGMEVVDRLQRGDRIRTMRLEPE